MAKLIKLIVILAVIVINGIAILSNDMRKAVPETKFVITQARAEVPQVSVLIPSLLKS